MKDFREESNELYSSKSLVGHDLERISHALPIIEKKLASAQEI